jgi:hypothetical protein
MYDADPFSAPRVLKQFTLKYFREFSLEYCILPIMIPSEDDITSFLAFAPEAGEGKAFLFLEVLHLSAGLS